MEDEKTEHEKIISRKATIFKAENTIVHLKKYDGGWYNGRLFEVEENHLIIHDRVEGKKKFYFIDIKSIEEYEVVE